MRLVIALGGNALLKRGEPMSVEVQRRNIRAASVALAPVIRAHSVIVTHGNGPQVGLLALQAAAFTSVPSYPLDVLGAESEGMIGYLLEQELSNLLGPAVPLATLLTQMEVDPRDPAFLHPTKPIGPVYSPDEAQAVKERFGWQMAQDGAKLRRVVPSPAPVALMERKAVEVLVQTGVTVICAGGGGVPVAREPNGTFAGVEAVIDKDWASELIAKLMWADGLIMLTDVDGVKSGYGTPHARNIRSAHPAALSSLSFDAGTMEPKVRAGVAFATATGGFAAIGALADLDRILSGEAGTRISMLHEGILYEQ